MKTLKITTERKFRNENEWNDYKHQMQEYMKVDWKELEEIGVTTNTMHLQGEEVNTFFNLYE